MAIFIHPPTHFWWETTVLHLLWQLTVFLGNARKAIAEVERWRQTLSLLNNATVHSDIDTNIAECRRQLTQMMDGRCGFSQRAVTFFHLRVIEGFTFSCFPLPTVYYSVWGGSKFLMRDHLLCLLWLLTPGECGALCWSRRNLFLLLFLTVMWALCAGVFQGDFPLHSWDVHELLWPQMDGHTNPH